MHQQHLTHHHYHRLCQHCYLDHLYPCLPTHHDLMEMHQQHLTRHHYHRLCQHYCLTRLYPYLTTHHDLVEMHQQDLIRHHYHHPYLCCYPCHPDRCRVFQWDQKGMHRSHLTHHHYLYLIQRLDSFLLKILRQ